MIILLKVSVPQASKAVLKNKKYYIRMIDTVNNDWISVKMLGEYDETSHWSSISILLRGSGMSLLVDVNGF